MKKLIVAAILLILVLLYFVGKPIIRDKKFSTLLTIEASIQSYDCSGENCIGFIVKEVSTKGFTQYKDKHLIPYQKGKSRDELQNQLANLINMSTEQVCLIGYLHKYTIDALGFIHPAAGSYKFELESFSKGACHASLP